MRTVVSLVLFTSILMLFPMSSPCSARSPIVLVHGFLGWGRDEMAGYRYWGGSSLNIERHLRSLGHPCITASVGPISSNHDRACELFYQLYGGTVDYGEEHASAAGHDRFGRTYEPALEVWDEHNPIHLIGHSMGGQTSRMLVHLLATDYFGVGSSSAWVASVTSISSPHDGTTLSALVDWATCRNAERIVGGLLSLSGTNLGIYDFNLDHWGISLNPGESRVDFFKRATSLLSEGNDLASYDLSPEGAQRLNEMIPEYPDVYYLSISNHETTRIPFTNRQAPSALMTTFLRTFALAMGRYDGIAVEDAESWWLNDGVVNTRSMLGPHTAKIVELEPGQRPEPGVWNHLGTVNGKDHLKIIGHWQGPILTGRWLRGFYEQLADFIQTLGSESPFPGLPKIED